MKKVLVKNAYKREYKIRTVGEGKMNTVVSIPREVVQREAEKLGITPKEFIKKYRAMAHFDDFQGVYYTFKPAENEEERK